MENEEGRNDVEDINIPALKSKNMSVILPT